MKHFYCLLIFVLSISSLNAQIIYGNEWIDESVSHYKIPIITDGMYRLDYSYLQANCPEIVAASSSEVCIYKNGVKIPIYVSWTGSPTASDFIEFYATRQDGTVDNKLFKDSSDWNLNPYVSLFQDTAYYFLTLRPNNNRHFVPYVNDTTSITTPFLSECLADALLNLKAHYSSGKRYYFSTSEASLASDYDPGEGWGDLGFASKAIKLPEIKTTSTKTSSIDLKLFGIYDIPHTLDITVNNNAIGRVVYTGSDVVRFSDDFATSFLAFNNTVKITTVLPEPTGYTHYLGYIKIKYPRTTTFSKSELHTFYLDASSVDEKMRLGTYSNIGGKVRLYDMTNERVAEHNGIGEVAFKINSRSTESQFILSNDNLITQNPPLRKVSFNSSIFPKINYIIIADRSLSYDSSNTKVLEELKSFKESQVGGNYLVQLTYTDELYDYFSYGIPKHPLSIKKYVQFLQSINQGNVKYLLLIGKGYTAYSLAKAAQSVNEQDLIPSYGYPASDYQYATMDYETSQHVAIGRISARSGQDVRNYLEKLKTYMAAYADTTAMSQTPANKDYMKYIVHLGGGTGQGQQDDFRRVLKQLEVQVKDTLIGANVFSLFKNDPDQTVDVTSTDLKNRINKGVSLITFFGHSASTIFDVGIDDPITFTNANKYPIMLANGCNTGYVFGLDNSYSEQFINLPNKGMIALLASTNFALNTSLELYTREFYKQIVSPNYLQTIGNLAKETSKTLLYQKPFDYENIVAMDFNINGDPSVPITHYNLPDYYIDPTYVYFEKSAINTLQDSIKLYVVIQNLGKAEYNTISVHVKRSVDNNDREYDFEVKTPFFKDTFEFNIPVIDDGFGSGINQFSVSIDYEDKILEITNENNNIATPITLFIENADILPMYPYEFSIVAKNPVSLIAANTLSKPTQTNYIIQIDSTELFNSPIMKSINISSSENVIRWTPVINMKNETVYYWRVQNASQPNPKWNTSSFVYIPSDSQGGWNQSHYYQYLKNSYQNLQWTTQQVLNFADDVKHIRIRTDGSSSRYEVEWYLNNFRQSAFREAARVPSGINIVWIDGKTGLIHESVDTVINGKSVGSYGSISFNYYNLTRPGFVFLDTGYTPNTHPTPNKKWSDVIVDFVDQIPDGDYVFFYTLKEPVYTVWDSRLVSMFNSIGFNAITRLTSGQSIAPFIYAFRKNNSSFAPVSKIGTDYITKTETEFYIVGNWKEGYEHSVKIGPTRQWQRLSYALENREKNDADQNLISLYGFDSANKKTLLWQSNEMLIDTSIEWISHLTYPNLQLSYYTKDTANRTPSILKFWRIHHRELPELTINNSANFVPNQIDTIENGDVYTLNFGVESLNNNDFDSLSLKMIINQGGQNKTIYRKTKPLKGNTLDKFSAVIDNSTYFEGENEVLYEINAKDYLHQSEKYAFNNFGAAKFFVTKDIYNPLLDVTFDGERIVNNELISTEPEIKIQLKDENKFLLLDDTALIQLYIRYPNGSMNPVYFKQKNLTYTLATSADNNLAEIIYKPTFTDGNYQLIVKDSDKSSNSSSRNGTFDYKITFNVITKKQISKVFNYPNPFSTSTQFVFTLTGKVPDYLQIQILNIRGQVVKEINKEQLGNLKVGLNKTEYRWDGRDQYGDLLANGVYLYKVTARDIDKEYQTMDEADFKNLYKSNNDLNKYFTKGWGKMVILR